MDSGYPIENFKMITHFQELQKMSHPSFHPNLLSSSPQQKSTVLDKIWNNYKKQLINDWVLHIDVA